jgi:hypothetical protein
MYLTFARLTEILYLNRGGSRVLVAWLDGKTVFLKSSDYEISHENFVFHATEEALTPEVDVLATACRGILHDLPELGGIKVWVEVGGVAYPVLNERVAVDANVVLFVLETETAVRP